MTQHPTLPEQRKQLPIQVIELPPGASAAGVRQLLRQSGEDFLVLVVRDRVDDLVFFQVVRRQAEAQGAQVAIVTRSSRVRELATSAGLPVFGSVEGAQSGPWFGGRSDLDYQPPPPFRDRRQPLSERRRGWLSARFRRVRLSEGDARPLPWLVETTGLIAVLILGIVAVTGLVAFIVPVATVTLVPAQEPLAARVTVVARPDVESPEAEGGLIPARRIGQRVEGEGRIAATGTQSAPDQPARGVVEFSNRRPDPQEIPAGTVVATSTGANVRFQTLEPAELPGGVGARITVPVEALESGPVGNVRAFAINTIEGSLALAANVINPQDMAGGSVRQVAIVTQADKDRLREQVLQQVRQKAYVALGDLLDEGEFVPPETVDTIVVAETYDRFTDERADQVSLRLRLLATALAVDGTAADELALAALRERIPRRGQLLTDSISYTRGEGTVDTDGETPEIRFDVTASSVVVLDVDPAAVRAAIRGLSPADAVEALQSNWRLQSPPELTLGPEWLLPVLRRVDFPWLPVPVADRVPWLPFRTQVRVEFAG